jgi:hypothetical protein
MLTVAFRISCEVSVAIIYEKKEVGN